MVIEGHHLQTSLLRRRPPKHSLDGHISSGNIFYCFWMLHSVGVLPGSWKALHIPTGAPQRPSARHTWPICMGAASSIYGFGVDAFWTGVLADQFSRCLSVLVFNDNLFVVGLLRGRMWCSRHHRWKAARLHEFWCDV